MVTAGEFDDQLATGKATSKTDTRHRRLGPTIHHPDLLNRGHPVADQFGHFHLGRIWNPEAETLGGGSLDRSHYFFRCVTQDRWSPSSHIVDVFVSFDIPNMLSLCPSDKERFSS